MYEQVLAGQGEYISQNLFLYQTQQNPDEKYGTKN